MIDADKNNMPLDLSYLREMSGDSTDFMIEMVEAFQKQTPLYMADLEGALLNSDWKGVAEYAHKIKPTFYYVGREDAKNLLQLIETQARSGTDVAQIPALFAEAKAFVERLYVQLDEAKTLLRN